MPPLAFTGIGLQNGVLTRIMRRRKGWWRAGPAETTMSPPQEPGDSCAGVAGTQAAAGDGRVVGGQSAALHQPGESLLNTSVFCLQCAHSGSRGRVQAATGLAPRTAEAVTDVFDAGAIPHECAGP